MKTIQSHPINRRSVWRASAPRHQVQCHGSGLWQRGRFSGRFIGWSLFAVIGLSMLIPVTGLNAMPESDELQEHIDFRRIDPPVPSAPDRIDVLLFFWLGDPEAEDTLDAWRQWTGQAPGALRFDWFPAILDDAWAYGTRVFHALREIGRDDLLPGLVAAMASEQVDYTSPLELRNWLERQGVDADVFEQAVNSDAVIERSAMTPAIGWLYQIQAAPSIVVAGRYVIEASATRTPAQMVMIAQSLAEGLRQGAQP